MRSEARSRSIAAPATSCRPLIRNLGSMLVQGAQPARDHPPVHGEGRFADARPRAQHPLRRHGPRLHRPDLASRRHGAGDGGRDAVASRCAARSASGSCTSATARHPRARSTRGSTSPRCSAARSSSSSRTTATRTRRRTRSRPRRRSSWTRRSATASPAIRADGNDVLATYDVTKRAVDRARRGEGVTLIELMTYRRKGHAEHDNQSYVPAGEIDKWEKRERSDRSLRARAARGAAGREEGARRDRRARERRDR